MGQIFGNMWPAAYEEDCSGFIKSKKTNWSLEWTSCNDTIVDQIVKIFPDVDLKFDQKHPKPGYSRYTEKRWDRRCIPFLWDGSEFCGPIEQRSVRAIYNIGTIFVQKQCSTIGCVI